MIHALPQGLAPALARGLYERVTLLLNHVIAAEPEAVTRLSPHVGQTIRVGWPAWPAWLPAPPQPVWAVTPAGLLELADEPPAPGTAAVAAEFAEAPAPEGLLVTIEPTAWAQWVLAGAAGAPPMTVQGDAAFATTLGWLAQHLRWDVEDDLARIVGDVPARAAVGVARGVLHAVQALAARLRPGSA